MEAITFPDAEAVVVAHLNSALAARSDSARAATSVPNPRPARFVRVVRTGGRRLNLAQEDAQITVECWEASAAGASGLARITYGLMQTLDLSTGGATAYVPQGSRGVVGPPASLPDPVSKSPRYAFTVIVRLGAQIL